MGVSFSSFLRFAARHRSGAWQALEAFCDRQLHWSIDYRRMRSDPAAVLREIAVYACLEPSATQWPSAEAFIDRA